MNRRARVAAALAAASLAAGCGGGGGAAADPPSTTDPGRSPTPAEAGLLAGALAEDLEAGGADFDVELRVQGAEVRVTGSVDWAGHAGTGAVTFGDAPPYDVVWTTDAVLQALPGIEERMAAEGRPGVRWVVHPAEPDQRRLDSVVAIVTGLASTTPDNPVNLEQLADVALLGAGEVDGVATTTFRSGDLVLSVGTDDGLLHRLVAPIAFADEPVTFTFTRHGPVAVPLPATTEVVDVAEVPELYDELTAVGVL